MKCDRCSVCTITPCTLSGLLGVDPAIRPFPRHALSRSPLPRRIQDRVVALPFALPHRIARMAGRAATNRVRPPPAGLRHVWAHPQRPQLVHQRPCMRVSLGPDVLRCRRRNPANMATGASRSAVPVVRGTRIWAAKPWWFAIGTWPRSTPFRLLVFRLFIRTCLSIGGRGLRRIAASLAPEIDAGVTRVVMGLGGWVDLRLGPGRNDLLRTQPVHENDQGEKSNAANEVLVPASPQA
jgi:hypothetical protein